MLTSWLWLSPEHLHIMTHPLPAHSQVKVGGELIGLWNAFVPVLFTLIYYFFLLMKICLQGSL